MTTANVLQGEARGKGAMTGHGASAASTGPGRALSPRAVTRGEMGRQQRTSVDWLNCTFPAPSMSKEGFVSFIGRLFGRPVSAIEGGGMLGFETALTLIGHIGSRTTRMGVLAFGGESQNGRWLFQLTGAGCGLVPDWEALSEFLQGLDGKITRVDLALDFLNGEHTVDEAVEMHAAGGFSLGARPPSTQVAGDWLERKEGRTLYVGKAKNGKMLRVYEKGRQLGDVASEWVRFEMQLGNRDRVIPFEALVKRDAYFAGCYPAMAELIADVEAEQIETKRKSGLVSLSHLMFHLKRCYGKVMDLCADVLQAPNAELVEEVRVFGLPRRLDPSSVAAGLTWGQLLSQIQRK